MPNRTICDVLKEMRSCIKTLNFSYLPSLIEEAQTMANRMEASLWDQHELKSIRDNIKESKVQLEALRREIKANEEIIHLTSNS